jgi:hypothetical protein
VTERGLQVRSCGIPSALLTELHVFSPFRFITATHLRKHGSGTPIRARFPGLSLKKLRNAMAYKRHEGCPTCGMQIACGPGAVYESILRGPKVCVYSFFFEKKKEGGESCLKTVRKILCWYITSQPIKFICFWTLWVQFLFDFLRFIAQIIVRQMFESVYGQCIFFYMRPEGRYLRYNVAVLWSWRALSYIIHTADSKRGTGALIEYRGESNFVLYFSGLIGLAVQY